MSPQGHTGTEKRGATLATSGRMGIQKLPEKYRGKRDRGPGLVLPGAGRGV